MRRGWPLSVGLASALMAVGESRLAHALTACTAPDIVAQDPGCPIGDGPCTITQTFDVGDGCEIDFGQRTLTIDIKHGLNIGPHEVILRAGSLTITPDG